jgi:hypothetical protein
VRKKKLKPAATSSRYRRFKNDRNAALEIMLNKARAQLHDVLRGAFQSIKEKIAFRYSTAPADSMLISSSHFINGIDSEIKKEFESVAYECGRILIRLKMYSFTLAMTGEAEALGQAIDYKTKYHISRDDIVEQAVSTLNDQSLGSRVELIFDRLRRRILDAVQLSRVQRLSVSDMLAKVDRALPKGRFIRRPAKMLRPVKEADTGKRPEDFSFGFVDDETWDGMVKYYLDQYVPTYQFRGPTPDSDYWYKDFELEQDMTAEFVASVRAGEHEAAKQNGVKDFVWIAVLDKDTCEDCCQWRAGLTLSEIEEELKGKHSDDECDSLVPPLHYNCRCDLAPLLEDTPDRPESNAKEFEDWLNS